MMRTVRRTIHSLLTATLAVLAMAEIARPAACEVRERRDPSHAGATDILPTLKGHMARLGSLMNFLFRNVDDGSRKAELISVVQEMKVHLRQSKQFEPLRLHLIADEQQHALAKAGYLACLTAALELLADLEVALRRARAGEPRTALLRLDQKRRDCHVAFG